MHSAKPQLLISTFLRHLFTIILLTALLSACSTAPESGYKAIPADAEIALSLPLDATPENQATILAFKGLDSLRQWLPQAGNLKKGRMFVAFIGLATKKNAPLWIFENQQESLEKFIQNTNKQKFRSTTLYRAGSWYLAEHQHLLLASPVRAHVEAGLNALEYPDAASTFFKENTPENGAAGMALKVSALKKLTAQVPAAMMPLLQEKHLYFRQNNAGQWALENNRSAEGTFDPAILEQIRGDFALFCRNEAGAASIETHFRKDMAAWVADWCWVAYPQKSDPTRLSPLLGLAIKPGQAGALQALLRKLPVLQQKTNMSGIFQVGERSWLPPAMGQALGSATPFLVVEENYVWVAATAAELERRQEKLLFGENAAQGSAIMELKQAVNFEKALVLLDADHLRPIIQAEHATLLMPQSGMYAMLAEAGFYPLARANISALNTGGPEYSWRATLNSPIRAKPGIVHLSNFSSEVPDLILVQEYDNFLNAFNRMGQLLWRRQIGAPICSHLYAVEGVQPGEGAILFNSADKIWKIDAQGRDLDQFPIQLGLKSQKGIQSADFEHNGKPVFFLNTDNGNIYGFDYKGLPKYGWSPLNGNRRYVRPPFHVQDKENDLLIVPDDQGQLYAFGRMGNAKGTIAGIGPAAADIYADSLSTPSVLLIKPLGKPMLSLDASGRQTPLACTSGAVAGAVLCVQEKGRVYYGIQEDRQLRVIPAKGETSCYNISFPGKPEWVFSPDGRHFACIINRKLVLYQASDGKMATGFPLSSHVPFYSKNLILGGIDQYLIVYQ